MSTAQHAIQQAITAALLAAPAVAAGCVYANRARPISAQQPSAVAVRLESSSGSTAVLGAIDWQTRYSVECYARAGAVTEPASAVDSLLAEVWARLVALQPSGLGLMSFEVDPALSWDYDDSGDSATVCATVHATATHRTTPHSLAPWA